MAQLTISFTTDPSAVLYRIKYRKVGTSSYTTVTTTTSPMVITSGVQCDFAYEGTVQAVCSVSPESTSPEVPWNAAAVSCLYFWAVTACNPESPVPPNNAVRTNNSSIGINSVVKLTGSQYQGHCYQITDTTNVTTGVVIDDSSGVFTSCFNCEQSL
jgi:hypothetical protein